MFNSFWLWFKANHNNIITFLKGFLGIFCVFVVILVVTSSIMDIPEYLIENWISLLSVSAGVISGSTLILLLISYLSPDEIKEDNTVISGKSILDIIDNMEKEMTEEEKLQEYAEFKTQGTRSRIYSAIQQQEKKSVINLVLGIIFSITGALALLYLVHNISFTPKDTLDFISNFLPRLSLVLLIETFAYFFLRLYKDNLKEIKYWHNELTAIEHRILAFNLALKRGDIELLNTISTHFGQFDKSSPLDSSQNFTFSADFLEKIIKSLKK